MDEVITLPRLAGTRSSARMMVDQALPLTGQVTVDANWCLSAAQGFVDEMVASLVDASVTVIVFHGARDRLLEDATRSAQLRGGIVVTAEER